MAYVKVETLEDGQVEADVVSRETYDAAVTERDGLADRLSALADKYTTMETKWRADMQKHADYLLGNPDTGASGSVKTIDELWK